MQTLLEEGLADGSSGCWRVIGIQRDVRVLHSVFNYITICAPATSYILFVYQLITLHQNMTTVTEHHLFKLCVEQPLKL